jgi:TolB-like protein
MNMTKPLIFLMMSYLLLAAGTSGQSIASGRQSSVDVSMGFLVQQISFGLSENQKQRVAVVEFVDLKGNTSDFGRYLAEELITRLFQTGKFKVIERQLLNKVITEQKLSLTGIIDPASAQKLGKLLGVDAICSGSVSDLGKSLKINARLINTETGEVFAVAAGEVAKDETVCALGGCAQGVSAPAAITTETGTKKVGQWKSQVGFLNFEVTGCVRAGTVGYCDFTVVNNNSDSNLRIFGNHLDFLYGSKNSRGIDDLGNEIKASSVTFGRDEKTAADLQLVSGVKVKMRLNFKDLSTSSQKFAVLEIGFRADEINQSTKFRDIIFTIK